MIGRSFELSLGSRGVVCRMLSSVAVLAALALGLPAIADAAAFQPGDLAVYRIGNGTSTLNENAGNPVFIDEYTPQGTLVQSIAMPTAVKGSQKRFVLDANSGQEGLMTLSTNERYLVAMGFDAEVGGATVATAATSVNRVVARVSGTGEADTSTALTNYATTSSAGLLRGVASVDGSRFWMAGATGLLFTSQTGVWTAAYGATTASQVSTGATGARAVEIFEGQLYAGNALGGTGGLGAIGTGLPTSSGQAYTGLPGVPTNLKLNQFYMADLNPLVPGEDTLYVADESAGSGTILKYAFNGTTWTAKGSVSMPATTGLLLRGLTGKTEGEKVTLYGTLTGSINSGGKLISMSDSSGATGTLTGTPTVVASAGSKQECRGLAFVPLSVASPPEAPTGVTAKGSEQAATLSWSPPAIEGGSAVTGYTVRIVRHEGGGETTHEVSPAARSYTFTGLEDGVAYDLSVQATNAVGSGPFASATGNPVTPAPTSPLQPASGPGGSSAPWGSVEINFHANSGNEDLSYWTVEPRGWRGEGAAPTEVPITVLMHGYGGTNITYDEAWATHLAEHGNFVIFPKYGSTLTPSKFYTPNAITSIKAALTTGASQPVKPNTALGMNLIGYSAGGPVAANVANEAAAEGLPTPRTLLLVHAWNGVDTIFDNDMLDASLANVPGTMRMACVVGNEDGVGGASSLEVGRTGCDKIWERLPQVTSKEYVWIYSDAHGSPALIANHSAPGDGGNGYGVLNSLDWYGYWKLADAERDCTIYDTNCSYLGGSHNEEFMGEWSDGVAVHPLTITNTVPVCPAVTETLGCEMAPQHVTAAAGARSATVSWSAPAAEPTPFPKENPYVGYAVSATPVGGGPVISKKFISLATTETLPGLTAGTQYDISVAAINEWKSSKTTTTNAPAPAQQNPITPFTVPGAPQGVSGEAAAGAIAVSWSAPSSDGGSAITGYTVTATPEAGGTPVSDAVGALASSDTLSGLSNGTAYDVSVAASNLAGSGSSAEASNNPLTPFTVPGAPLDVSGEAEAGAIAVTWSAPSSDGGSAITGYTVTATPHAGGTPVSDFVGGQASSDTLAGLSNGAAYDVSVAAANVAGSGPSAEASENPLTPLEAPGAPSIEGASPNADGLFSVTWSGPEPNQASGLTYTLQHHDASTETWSTVASGIEALSYAFSAPGESEGTWVYRVGVAVGVSTEYSPASAPVIVDETAPNAPTATASRPPDYAGGGGWYEDSVMVSFSANGDPQLADTSAPSGIAPSSLSVPQTFESSGTFTASGTVADKVGNVSLPGTLAVQVDATAPELQIECPASAKVGEAGVAATVVASDGQSGLLSDPSGSVPISTTKTGPVTVTRTASDNVGHETTSSCTTQIVESPPEFGHCTKAPSHLEGRKTVYDGWFSSKSCTFELPTRRGKYEWSSGATRTGVSIALKAGTAVRLETTTKSRITCTGESGTAAIESARTLSGVMITLTGCTDGSGEKCTTAGSAPGEIETKALEGLLGIERTSLKGSKESRYVGLELKPAGESETFLEYGCGADVTVLSGSVVGSITSDKTGTSGLLKHQQKTGKQKSEGFSGAAAGVLSDGEGRQVGLADAVTLTYEEPLEINAFF